MLRCNKILEHTSHDTLQLFSYFPLLIYSFNTSFWFSGPNSLCHGLPDGNYELTVNSIYYPNFFLSCSNYIAYCRPCAPAYPPLVYSQACDQCLSAYNAGKSTDLFYFVVWKQHELFVRHCYDLQQCEVLNENWLNM